MTVPSFLENELGLAADFGEFLTSIGYESVLCVSAPITHRDDGPLRVLRKIN